MSVIIIIAVVIIGLIALLFIAAIFTKKSYQVQREIIIDRPKQQVFDYIKMLKNQDNYNKWWKMDPDAKKDFIGTDGTIGFTAFWDSENKKVGKGEQEIKGITDGQLVDYEIRFVRPFTSTSKAFIATETAANNGTLVKWGFSGSYSYPTNVILLLMNMDNLLGGDIHESLVNLKNAIESKYPKN